MDAIVIEPGESLGTVRLSGDDGSIFVETQLGTQPLVLLGVKGVRIPLSRAKGRALAALINAACDELTGG